MNTSITPAAVPNRRYLLRFFWLALCIVAVQRCMLAVHDALALRRVHAPITLYHLFVQGYAHWDATWYVLLAQTGYTSVKSTAFWPFYPLLMRILHILTHFGLATCGIIISLISFVFAVDFLGLLAARIFSIRTAVTAMMLFAFFPTAFFLDAVYTESLFMALSIATAYFSSRRRFYLAGICAALATLTRNTGLLLILVIMFEYMRARRLDWRIWRLSWWRRLDLSALGLTFPVVVLGLYCVWLKSRFGSYLAFIEAERLWHRHFMWPWESWWHAVRLAFPSATAMGHWYFELEAVTFIIAVSMLLIGLRYLGKSLTHVGWWSYMFVVVWMTSSEPALNVPDYLLSFPRFILMLFPGFIYFAEGIRPRWLLWILWAAGVWFLLGKSEQFFFKVWIA